MNIGIPTLFMEPMYTDFARLWIGSLNRRGEFVPQSKIAVLAVFDLNPDNPAMITQTDQIVAGPGPEDIGKDPSDIAHAIVEGLMRAESSEGHAWEEEDDPRSDSQLVLNMVDTRMNLKEPNGEADRASA